MDEASLLAKCEELLATLDAHPGHAKLRRLTNDLKALRDRLRVEQADAGLQRSEPHEGSSDSSRDAAS
jgi:hypothetical protein